VNQREVSVKKKWFLAVALLAAFGCSSSRPEIVETSITDSSPVAGQRVYVQVSSITDTPPMSYAWSASAGVIQEIDGSPYGIYWTAPDMSGTCIITVRVTDSDGNGSTHSFPVHVEQRVLEGDLLGEGARALSIAKQSDSRIGGVWVSVEGRPLRFISSCISEDSRWLGDFPVMLARTSATSGAYTIWGARSVGRDISVITSNAVATLACGTCSTIDAIRAMAIDVINTDVLWVGTSSVLTYFDQYAGTWSGYLFADVYDLCEGPDYVYAATGNGAYRLDGSTPTLLSPGFTTAILARKTEDKVEVWSVTRGVVMRDFAKVNPQPPVVVSCLDEDIAGGVWCGKYRWDGASWSVPEGLETVNVVQVSASTEGRVYFLSDSGVLSRW